MKLYNPLLVFGLLALTSEAKNKLENCEEGKVSANVRHPSNAGLPIHTNTAYSVDELNAPWTFDTWRPGRGPHMQEPPMGQGRGMR
jgi:hypothetical protein